MKLQILKSSNNDSWLAHVYFNVIDDQVPVFSQLVYGEYAHNTLIFQKDNYQVHEAGFICHCSDVRTSLSHLDWPIKSSHLIPIENMGPLELRLKFRNQHL